MIPAPEPCEHHRVRVFDYGDDYRWRARCQDCGEQVRLSTEALRRRVARPAPSTLKVVADQESGRIGSVRL